jgi:hypothetical protein
VTPIEIDSVATHMLYTDLVGHVLAVDDFGVLVEWTTQNHKMRRLCGEPRRHPIQFLVPANEWKSVPKTSEGLSCVDEEIDDAEPEHKSEAEVPEIEDVAEEPAVEAAIEEAADSAPLPSEEELEDLYEEEP